MKRLAVIASLLCWLAVGLAGCSTVDGWVEDAHESLDSRIAIEEARIAGGSDSPVVVDNDSGNETADDIDLSSAKWHGPSGASAVVVAELKNLRFDGHLFHFTPPEEMRSWTPKSAANKNCNALACFFVLRNGVWTGGKFDYTDITRPTRERKNIDGGYTGGVIPQPGEKVRLCLMDLNGTKRTTAPETVWK